MKKHTFWETVKRHKKLVSGVCVFGLCIGILAAAGGGLKAPDTVKSNQNIPEHDGDVLVDSIHIQEETTPGGEAKQDSQKQGSQKESAKKDSELVTSDDVSDLENSDTYFEEMRATINMDRNEVISMLTDAENTAESSAEKDNATQKKLQLLEYMQQEQDVENAIRAKGLAECLVLITESGVNVTVDKQDLNQSDVAKICDVVMRETKRKAPEIVIQSRF